MKKLILTVGLVTLLGCNSKIDTSVVKKEVEKAETEFNDYASKKGIANAFYEFAAEDAVIKGKNDTLIKGKESIKKYFSAPKFEKATVTWKADFIDVSEDGSMAYTYGKYIWIATDSIGNKKEFKGVFHTVWKKQKDGKWKYVWD